METVEGISLYYFRLLRCGSFVIQPQITLTARPSGYLRGVVVPREVDIVLNEHSEVFSTAQKCRPGREE
jgi:hypothetical protein